jgi:hypothetical protein
MRKFSRDFFEKKIFAKFSKVKEEAVERKDVVSVLLVGLEMVLRRRRLCLGTRRLGSEKLCGGEKALCLET